MSFYPSRFAIAAASSAIALLFIGSPSQASECDDVITNINSGIAILEGLEAQSKTFETSAQAAKSPGTLAPIMNDFADSVDGMNRSLTAVAGKFDAATFQDGQLLQLQQQYATDLKTLIGLFGQLAKGLRDMETVLQIIASTPREQITPEMAQQWIAETKQVEANITSVNDRSKTTTTSLDNTAKAINQHCGRRSPQRN